MILMFFLLQIMLCLWCLFMFLFMSLMGSNPKSSTGMIQKMATKNVVLSHYIES